jgi:dolichol-phosphate mannosyltransferase
MKKNLIFSATYNESENISKYINEVLKYSAKSDLLLIDDNSPDKTFEIIKKYSRKYKNIYFIIRNKKLGLDSAHKIAYQYALKKKYQKLITMDADLSHNPKEIPKILKILNKYDFVIGSRYIKGGKNKTSFMRYYLSFFGNKLISFLLRSKIAEHTTSYRGFNLEKMKNFNLNEVKSFGYSFFMETVFLMQKKNFTIREIPIIFEDRKFGKSKIPKIEIFRTLKNLLIILLKKNRFNYF